MSNILAAGDYDMHRNSNVELKQEASANMKSNAQVGLHPSQNQQLLQQQVQQPQGQEERGPKTATPPCLSEGRYTSFLAPLKSLTSPVASSVFEADAKQQQLLKDSLTADLKLLLHEFERFQQATALVSREGSEEVEAMERAAKVEFFLGYIGKVLQELAGADAPKLQELEVRIKTSLLPLKGQVVNKLASSLLSSSALGGLQHEPSSSASIPSPSSSPSSSCSTHTTPPISPVSGEKMTVQDDGRRERTHPTAAALMPSVRVQRLDSSSSGATTCSENSEEGRGQLDDMECLSLLMEEDGQGLGRPQDRTAGGREWGLGPDEDVTDAASLVSEESSNVFAPSPGEASEMLETISRGLGLGQKRLALSEGSTGSLGLASASFTSVESMQQLKRARSTVIPSISSNSISTTSSSSVSVGHGSSEVSEPSMSVASAEKPQVRQVEYQCGVCAESYSAAASLNPWWALEKQECPQCKKLQIPRIDINLPANTMDYHPALLAEEGDDDDEEEGLGLGGSGLVPGEEFRGMGKGGEDSAVGGGIGVPEEEDGQAFSPAQASQILELMSHARTCPGHHHSEAHRAVCTSTKYLMLHVRDCDGKTLDGEACGFSWCRPCKHLLGHLVRCYESEQCSICRPQKREPCEEAVACKRETSGAVREGVYRSLTSLC